MTETANLDAEVSVLGAMLLREEAIAEVRGILQPTDFYRGAHRTACEAIYAMHDRGAPVDAVTVADELQGRGQLEGVGGALAIADWTAATPTAAAAQYYARIVQEHARRRALAQVGADIGKLASHGASADDAHEAARQLLAALDRHEGGVRGDSTWTPLDLGPVLDALADGGAAGETPTMLARADGAALLYPGRVHALYGETESGKTWLALHACAERLSAGEAVLYLDFEDTAAATAARLLAVGALPEAIRERFLYVNPGERLGDRATRDLAAALARAPTLAVIDGVTESLALEGLSLGDNTDVAAWQERLPRTITRTGAAVLLLDHVTKHRETRGRWAIGAQHKLAGIDGAAYTLRLARPFDREHDGLLMLEVAKDRHGAVRSHAAGGRIAEVRVRPHPAGLVLTLAAPTDSANGFRPTTLMERVSRALEAEPQGLTVRGVLDAVTGNRDATRQALAVLVEEQYVRRENGPRGAHRHHSERPYRADDDAKNPERAPVPRPCPEHAQGTVDSDCAPVPRPLRGGTGTGHGHDGHTPQASAPPTAGHGHDDLHDGDIWTTADTVLPCTRCGHPAYLRLDGEPRHQGCPL